LRGTRRRRNLANRLKGDAMSDRAASASDREILTSLNRDYIRSVQDGDVRRFDEILAADFRCSNPDGSLVDRSGFLAQTARPVTIANLTAHDVEIRLFGDVAIIHARTSYTMSDGRPGAGRYTDVWARQNGQWLAISAHVTRC
jgi:ketosteroid isomerase-like protein